MVEEDDPDIGPDHPAVHYFQLIGASCRRIVGMLEDVLNYSKVGGGLRGQQTSLHAAAAEVARDPGITFGPGEVLDCEDLLRVLEPLVRLHRNGDGDGSGLGLAICRRIAQGHDGELTLTETPGGGTTAVATFPAAQQQPPFNVGSVRRRFAAGKMTTFCGIFERPKALTQ